MAINMARVLRILTVAALAIGAATTAHSMPAGTQAENSGPAVVIEANPA
ncbi:hypothetical protein [Myceligenerans xiligouense]|nr:hypothetical protein [Myceligenerans xiligouense]